MNDNGQSEAASATKTRSPWQICGWVCVGVVVISVASCVALSAFRSVAVTDITVTALKQEPKDPSFSFINQLDALPDYELRLLQRRGGSLSIGVKPNSSAADGLTWHLHDPISVHSISTIRLLEQDTIISDLLAEVEFTDGSVTQNGYKFDFATAFSFSAGLEAFFELPIGKAIAAGFTIAILFLLLRLMFN